MSRALNLVSDPDNTGNVSHVETDYSLEELGIATMGKEFTVAFWVRTERAHLGTILSATRPGGSEQVLSFQVKNESQNGLIPMRLSFNSTTHNWSSASGHAVPGGKWTHIVWTEEPDERTIYINGVPLS